MSASSTPPPRESLPYAITERQDPFWPALRVGVIVWSAAILLRHAFYWFGVVAGGTVRAMALAGVEAIVLLLLLIAACTAGRRGPVRLTMLTLASLCGLYLLVSVVGYGFDLYDTGFRPAHGGWLFAVRVQLWAIPLAVIVAAVRVRD